MSAITTTAANGSTRPLRRRTLSVRGWLVLAAASAFLVVILGLFGVAHVATRRLAPAYAQPGYEGEQQSVLWRDASLTIIDVGGTNTHMYVVQNQRLQFIRGVKFGADLFSQAVQKTLEVDREQAEALIALATEQGFALFLAIGGILRGATRTALGQRGEVARAALFSESRSDTTTF